MPPRADPGLSITGQRPAEAASALRSPGSSNRNFKNKPPQPLPSWGHQSYFFSFLILWVRQTIESLCFIREVNEVYFFRTWSEVNKIMLSLSLECRQCCHIKQTYFSWEHSSPWLVQGQLEHRTMRCSWSRVWWERQAESVFGVFEILMLLGELAWGPSVHQWGLCSQL